MQVDKTFINEGRQTPSKVSVWI